MAKILLPFAFAAICIGVAFRYFRPDFSDFTGAAAVADIDRAMPRAVLPAVASEQGDWGNLGAYKGKVVLIAFWATWCPTCVHEVPTLIQLQQEFGEQGFNVVAVAVDDNGAESVDTFVRNRRFAVRGDSVPINYPVLLGDHQSAHELGSGPGLPNCVLVNRDGREVKVFRGALDESVYAKAIQKLLKK